MAILQTKAYYVSNWNDNVGREAGESIGLLVWVCVCVHVWMQGSSNPLGLLRLRPLIGQMQWLCKACERPLIYGGTRLFQNQIYLSLMQSWTYWKVFWFNAPNKFRYFQKCPDLTLSEFVVVQLCHPLNFNVSRFVGFSIFCILLKNSLMVELFCN